MGGRRGQFIAQFDHAHDLLEQKGSNLDEIFATRYWDLTDEQFAEVSERKLRDFREGNDTRPVNILRIARMMFPLANNGLLSISSEALETLFLEKSEALRSGGSAEFSNLGNYISNLSFGDLSDPRYLNVRNVLCAIDEEAEKAVRKSQLTALVMKLSSDAPAVIKELIEGAQGLARHPIFAEVEPTIVFDAILKMNPTDIIAIRNFIENRYEESGIGRTFGIEHENLDRLSTLLLEHLKSAQPKLSTHAMGVLVKSLQKACQHLQVERAEIDAKKLV